MIFGAPLRNVGAERCSRVSERPHVHQRCRADINAASVIAGLKGLPACRLCADLSPKADAVSPRPSCDK